MNTNVQNNNEATKRLRQKLTECEKEMQARNEEVTKLKNKVGCLKQMQSKFETMLAEK